MKKKLLAFMLVAAMVLGMSTTAMAEGTKTAASKAATYNAVFKAYTVNGTTDASLYPAETLKFTSTAATTNPDGGAANLTINDLAVAAKADQELTINVPSFTKVGTYHFTISETAGNTQGVTYTDATIAVSVLVEYDYDDTDKDGYTMTATVGITSDKDAKNDTFTNIYDLGSLAVTKEVTGNLGDKNKEFEVDVTFNATKEIKSAITYVDGAETKTIAVADMADKTETVTITLKHGETVNFTNIPAGVTYTVVEHDYTTGDKNGENGYDAAAYTESDSTKTIAANDNDTVKITNNKATTVDTGLIINNMPYIVMLAVVAGAVVLFVMNRRRNMEF